MGPVYFEKLMLTY